MRYPDAKQLALMGELGRALRRQDWREVFSVARRAGLSSQRAGLFVLEEYEKAKAEGREPVGDR